MILMRMLAIYVLIADNNLTALFLFYFHARFLPEDNFIDRCISAMPLRA